MTFVAEKPTGTKREIFHDLALQAQGLFRGERDPIANAANLSSLIFTSLDDLNWSGFYFLKGGVLVLGPFQGRPACVRIDMGKGVCGTAAAKRETLIVKDVNRFPGHIACDVASQSEIVVPLVKGGNVIGVLDIDAPVTGRFDAEDRNGLEHLAQLWLDASDI
ncbi:MAG: GAF domain-containing protein [Proteobacteria bacterium]|nr:GAF domain-containing protein [Pseudomonadota bacterium]